MESPHQPITRLHELTTEPALTVQDRSFSYAELAGVCGALATQLSGLKRVAFWASNSLESCVAALACIETGAEAVALNPKLGSAELDHILSDSQPQAILAAPADGNGTPLGSIPHIPVDLAARALLPLPTASADTSALIIYTSGTTGPPKGVRLSRKAITANLDALAQVWGWTAADRLTHALPIFHIHGLILGLLGPLRRGGHVRHLVRFTPDSVASALADGDTMFFGVPTMYHRLADAAEKSTKVAHALKQARLLVSGSAPLPASTFTRIERATGQRVIERYGLTETMINTAIRADGDRRPGEVGVPLPGVELRLRTEDGTDAPWDGETIGEVLVAGPNLFLEYLNQPAATANVYQDGWFATGDLAVRTSDGYVRIVGRKSTDLIKTGGFKVGAGEVENALLGHAGVAEAAVAGRPDEDLGERIVAWVVPVSPDALPEPSELIDYVAALLAPHRRPREVHFVEELPRNAMGKVIKTRLTLP